MPYVCILICSDGSLYVRQTLDLHQRLRKHNAGGAARCARDRRPPNSPSLRNATHEHKELAASANSRNGPKPRKRR